jgi:hypothetical protein
MRLTSHLSEGVFVQKRCSQYDGVVQPRCSCGALLPEDARFCHKCGQPQYEEDIARLNEQAAEPAVAPPAPAPAAGVGGRIGFSNLRAVGITGAVAACSLVGLSIACAVAPLLVPLVLCGAGFAAAKFYKSRMAQPLTPFNGATLGMMTGFWLFLMVAICVAMTSVWIGTPEGQEVLRAFSAKMPELAKIVDDPHQVVIALAQGLIPCFFILTISAAFGGMLAARMQARNGRPS